MRISRREWASGGGKPHTKSHAGDCNSVPESGKGKDELRGTVKSGRQGMPLRRSSSQSVSPLERGRAVICASNCNTRISPSAAASKRRLKPGVPLDSTLEQQTISRTGRKRRASCNMHAVSSCGHGCVRGDLDAQHAAGGERGRKESGRCAEE